MKNNRVSFLIIILNIFNKEHNIKEFLSFLCQAEYCRTSARLETEMMAFLSLLTWLRGESGEIINGSSGFTLSPNHGYKMDQNFN